MVASHHPGLIYPQWQHSYESVLLGDPTEFPNRIQAAEAAIHRRLRELLDEDAELNSGEWEALQKAWDCLRLLRQNRTGI